MPDHFNISQVWTDQVVNWFSLLTFCDSQNKSSEPLSSNWHAASVSLCLGVLLLIQPIAFPVTIFGCPQAESLLEGTQG